MTGIGDSLDYPYRIRKWCGLGRGWVKMTNYRTLDEAIATKEELNRLYPNWQLDITKLEITERLIVEVHP